jgi:hypothetical protein
MTRRYFLEKLTPAERKIQEALAAVEELGADPRLSDAYVLLSGAGEAVADFVDGVDPDIQRSCVMQRRETTAPASSG